MATTTAPPEPSPASPERRLPPAYWVRTNLFPNWWNGLLTVVFAPLLAWVLFRAARFAFVTGRWAIIEVNLTTLMVGLFPRTELWRLWVAGALLAATAGFMIGITAAIAREAAETEGRAIEVTWQDTLRRMVPPLLLLAVLIVFVRTALPILLLFAVLAVGALAYRSGRALPHQYRAWLNVVIVVGVAAALVVITQFGGVGQRDWGGFLLTAYFTVGSLLLAFPLGVLLALGRRSTLPAVRVTCVVYIEFFRGSPLIALLFFGIQIFDFFFPPNFPIPDRISRALIIFTLFTSAYVAEIVRGGLQAIPRGQWEAAQALGLSPWKQVRRIILPQALRTVIPALVGQAISLYKDTPLVFVIGLLDLFRVATRIPAQEAFLGQGLIVESLVFVSLIYWVGSYWMSRESQRLEARLGIGQR